MTIKNINNVDKIKFDLEGTKGTAKQLVIGKADAAPFFSFRVITIEANGHSPYHSHSFEHMNYVIEGHGAIVTETGEEREIKKGDFALILPDEKHQYKNKSNEESLVFICAVPKDYE